MPAQYYNRFDAAKQYEEHLFIAGRPLQSAELNEVQRSAANRLRGVANVLFKDGAIMRDCAINVDPSSGAVTCGSGTVYANGAVRSVEAASLTIPVNTYVSIGVRLIETVVTDLTDPDLLDPATGTRSYAGQGAARLKIQAVWATHLDGVTGDFYAIYDVYNGVVVPKEAPPVIDAVSTAIQRYDQDSTGGTYLISGMGVKALSDGTAAQQVYRVSSGAARINGRSIELVADRVFKFDALPDLKTITSEPHLSSSSSTIRINTDFSPINSIDAVHITVQKTVSMVHGVVTGASDLLPDTSVIQLVTVSQGGTTYTATTDYLLTGGRVDWSPAGAEPAPGSTYSVTYKYINAVSPTAVDATGFSVTGAVSGTLVLADYSYKQPRIDRLCMGIDGQAVLIRGVPARELPARPAVPQNLLLLSTIDQTWKTSLTPVDDSTRMVPMETLNGFNTRLDRLLMLFAQLELQSNVAARDAAVKKSIFVDPFFDDSMRDAGQIQTAAVVSGALTLPVRIAALYFGADVDVPTTLPSTLQTAVAQESRTGSMAVNPYDSFSLLPSAVTLSPAADQMTFTVESWTSSRTNRIVSKTAVASQAGTTSTESVDLLSSTTDADQYIRPQNVDFTIDGFGPGETLLRVAFENVDVPTVSASTGLAVTVVANGSGHVAGRFRIPSGVASGVKQVQFAGSAGSYGVANFTAASWTLNKTLQRVVTENVYEYDPPKVVASPVITTPTTTVAVDPDPVFTEVIDPPARTFVEGLYYDLLGRAPDGPGLAYWNAQLTSTEDPSFITRAFVNAAVDNHDSVGTTAQAIWDSLHDSQASCIVDPIAQTFTLSKSAQISAVDVWFSAVGTSPVLVQLRAVSNGFPTRKVLAEARRIPSAIAVNGSSTRFEFSAPLYAPANDELAVVVLSNDAVTQVDIAQLGEWTGTRWVTEQPYTVGVLLSSSNAITWTAHQDRDLRFRVLTSQYTATTRTVNLGNVAVNSVTDLMVMGLASKPSAPTDVSYRVTIPGGDVRIVPANMPINLPAAVTGNVQVEALLSGSAEMSPVLYPDGQLAMGWISTTADYITRAMTGGAGVRVRVVVDAALPSGSTLAFRYKGTDPGDVWSASAMPLISSVAVDSGYAEMIYEVTGVTENFLQIKATLTGTAAARPFLRNLRIMVI